MLVSPAVAQRGENFSTRVVRVDGLLLPYRVTRKTSGNWAMPARIAAPSASDCEHFGPNSGELARKRVEQRPASWPASSLIPRFADRSTPRPFLKNRVG